MASSSTCIQNNDDKKSKIKEQPRKVKKFMRCNKKMHLNLRTTTCLDNKLEIIILKGGLPKDQLLYIKQIEQYQVRYNDNDMNKQHLLASIPKHPQMIFNFNSIASYCQYIINNNFIRFRNRGPTSTKHVSIWRIYQFEGDITIFNIWCVIRAFEIKLGIESSIYNKYRYHKSVHHVKKKNKTKDYHLNAYQTSMKRTDVLTDDILKNIFSFLNGSKYHCWIHIHEIIDNSHHRSNLIGLEFDSSSRNVYVMQRSPALLKKVRQIGDKYFTRKNNTNNSILTDSFFKKSVELFKAVY